MKENVNNKGHEEVEKPGNLGDIEKKGSSQVISKIVPENEEEAIGEVSTIITRWAGKHNAKQLLTNAQESD